MFNENKNPNKCSQCFNSSITACSSCHAKSGGCLLCNGDPKLVEQLHEIHYGGKDNLPWFLK